MRSIKKTLPLIMAVAASLTAARFAQAASCANQNFDTTPVTSLPKGWTSTVATGAPVSVGFQTRNVYADSGTKSAFIDDYLDYADVSLYSPALGVVNIGSSPNITFRHSYYLWSPDQGPDFAGAFNGAVLEISINGGAFGDITASGGSFVAGGYNTYLDTNFDNPIAQPPLSPGRSVWSGDSDGFKTVTVTLPTTAYNGTAQLRWRLGTEGGSRSYDTHSGWYIDSLDYSALGDVIFRDGFDGGCPN